MCAWFFLPRVWGWNCGDNPFCLGVIYLDTSNLPLDILCIHLSDWFGHWFTTRTLLNLRVSNGLANPSFSQFTGYVLFNTYATTEMLFRLMFVSDRKHAVSCCKPFGFKEFKVWRCVKYLAIHLFELITLARICTYVCKLACIHVCMYACM